MRNMIKTVIVAAAVVLGSGRARRGQAARRRVDRDARRSQPPGGRRSGRRHVAVARLPGPALRRGQAVAGARAQPRRCAGLRRAGSGGRVAAAAGAAVAQRAIQRGQPGNIDASTAIRPEDVPNVPSDQLRALGDIHPLGNPHYWIPPKNARAIARLLAERFTALDAGGAATYKAELARFEARLAAKEKEWEAAAAPLKGTRIVTFHKSWSYVARWLGLEEVGYIEPKPGIPPTANHTAQLVELMKKNRRAAGRRRVVLPEHDGEVRRRQRQGAPGRRAVERRRDARDQDLLRPGRRGDRGAQGRLTRHTARARARTWTSAAPALQQRVAALAERRAGRVDVVDDQHAPVAHARRCR